MQSTRRNQIADAIVNPGYAIVPSFLGDEIIAALADDARAQWSAGAFKQAGIGRSYSTQINSGIRSDAILWLDEPVNPAQHAYQDALENLRLEINRSLALGLFEHEAHYARYAPGDYYRRHRDQFADDASRLVSTLLYLNQDWSEEDGGALRLYLDAPGEADTSGNGFIDIWPSAGTLVVFRSADFEHEVLPARRERLSIAGWYRKRR